MNTDAFPDPPDEEDVDPAEIDAAGDRPPDGAPEVSRKLEGLTEWDRPLDAEGHKVSDTPLEDEVSVAEELVGEGVDEADRDQRLASADPDFES